MQVRRPVAVRARLGSPLEGRLDARGVERLRRHPARQVAPRRLSLLPPALSLSRITYCLLFITATYTTVGRRATSGPPCPRQRRPRAAAAAAEDKRHAVLRSRSRPSWTTRRRRRRHRVRSTRPRPTTVRSARALVCVVFDEKSGETKWPPPNLSFENTCVPRRPRPPRGRSLGSGQARAAAAALRLERF